MPLIPPVTSSKTSAIVYPKVTIREVFRYFWGSIKKHWVSGALAVIGAVVVSAMQLIVPLQYKRFFDLLSSGGEPAALAPQLTQILFLVLGLYAIIWLSYRLNQFANVWFQVRVMSRLRASAFEYLILHSYSFFSNNFTGSLTQRINRYARAFERLVDRFLWDVVPLVIRISGIGIILWHINPIIAYIVIAWAVVFMATNYALAKWKLKFDVEAAAVDSRLTGTLSDSITNHQSIQLFAGEEVEGARFREVNRLWKSINEFRWNIDNVSSAFQSGLMFVIEFFLFYYAIIYWERGAITVGFFVLIQAYLISVGDRLWNFSRIIRDVYEGFADAKEMCEILKLSHDIVDAPGAQRLAVSEGTIEFDKVSFAFNKTRTVLDEVSLEIRGGEKVALVGPSGAGKSTFVRLLLRLYEIGGGHIRIDGQSVSRVTQESLRSAISLVPQDPVLFHRSLMENIRYGRRDATDAEVIEAARLAHCDEFIEELPKKYETFVGERGIKLSGGERQRVAIARAILKNAPILILDEATSSLDSHSESLIQDALDTLMKGRTTIVIAHRLSTIKKMDRIVVFDEGRVIETGTHDELSQKPGGMYARLWSLQAGGFLREE